MSAGYKVRQLVTSLIVELVAAAGVTIDGLRIKDGTVKPAAGGTAFVDLTDCASGEGDVILRDNVADAHTVREASTPYLTYQTTNNRELIFAHKPIVHPYQMVNMGGTGHALVYGASGTGITKITSNYVLVIAAASDDLQQMKLPDPSHVTGVLFELVNIGGQSVVLRDKDGLTTGVNEGSGLTVPTGRTALIVSTGTALYASLR